MCSISRHVIYGGQLMEQRNQAGIPSGYMCSISRHVIYGGQLMEQRNQAGIPLVTCAASVGM